MEPNRDAASAMEYLEMQDAKTADIYGRRAKQI